MEGQSNLPKVSRRGFFKFVGGLFGGGAAAVAGAAAENKLKIFERWGSSDENLQQKVKAITLEDFQNPESEKFKDFVHEAAQAFVRTTEFSDVDPSYLQLKTKFHTSTDSFILGVRNVGGSNFDPEGKPWWAITSYDVQWVNFDLEQLGKSAREDSEYPGLSVLSTLLHEWMHLTRKERFEGEYLNNERESLYGEKQIQEPWKKFRRRIVFQHFMYQTM